MGETLIKHNYILITLFKCCNRAPMNNSGQDNLYNLGLNTTQYDLMN